MEVPHQNATILYIEDEIFLLEEFQEELSSKGYRVLTASNSDEAEAILEFEQPDVVLCDVMMPGRNGFELLTDLRREGKLSDRTAFIFVTALSDREPKLAGMRAGAVDYITKPVDLDLLHLKLENTLAYGQRSHASPPETPEQLRERKYPNIRLSPREEQVLTLLGAGDRTSGIAFKLSISEHTVNQYIKDLYRKLGLGNRADAARAAIEMGYVQAQAKEG